jgi:hypothetical protein
LATFGKVTLLGNSLVIHALKICSNNPSFIF